MSNCPLQHIAPMRGHHKIRIRHLRKSGFLFLMNQREKSSFEDKLAEHFQMAKQRVPYVINHTWINRKRIQFMLLTML